MILNAGDGKMQDADTASPFGVPVLQAAVPVATESLRLMTLGIQNLWNRIVAADPKADHRPLILSYDVHPTAHGPVLVEVNTNAGGILTAIEAARRGNECCAEWERGLLEQRVVALFRRDLLGDDPDSTGVVAIVDDRLESQSLLAEMQALADLIRPHARQVLVVDAAELAYADERLRHGGTEIDRVYWRSTDFLLTVPAHAPVQRAADEDTIVIAPTPDAYRAIADKRRFIEWSRQPELSRDERTGVAFRIAETLPFASKDIAEWYRDRTEWVFKPTLGYASRGVYVGKRVSRQKLAQLPPESYLAQRYAPHPTVDRDGTEWKYDVRFFADRGQVIGAVARVFQGQVVGMRTHGSGFAPIRVGNSCCLIGALSQT